MDYSHVAWLLGLVILVRIALQIRLWHKYKYKSTLDTVIVLGSGGHTAEMLALLKGFDRSLYTPRCYVVAATDTMSSQKAHTFEALGNVGMDSTIYSEMPLDSTVKKTPSKLRTRSMQSGLKTATAAKASLIKTKHRKDPFALQQLDTAQFRDDHTGYSVVKIPRSREVGQSFKSSIKTTLVALYHAARTVLRTCPDIVLVNGPGTCIPVCIAAIVCRILGLSRSRIIYVESIARVYKLSLSGKILYHLRLADAFFVQWQELVVKYPRALYAGRLM